MVDVVIIGGGISGASLARELSKYELKTLVLEKENDIAYGSTKANSGIVHGGYDPEPGTLMAKYNIWGNKIMEGLCKDLYVPYKRTGALVVAFSKEELSTLQELYDRGIQNGIPAQNQAILSQDEVRAKEPNISSEVLGAYWCDTVGVVSSFELCIGLMDNAMMNGVEVHKSTKVLSISKQGEHFEITTNNPSLEKVQCRYVVNAAGGHADHIHNMLEPSPYQIKSRRGEYYLLSKTQGKLVNTVVFQCPSDKGKGVLVSPTAHGNLIVGPNAYFVDDPDNVDTTPMGLAEVRELSKKSVPNIPFATNLRNYSGNRAESTAPDFIIGEVKSIPGFFEIAGIKSPGLTSAPAIAIDVVDMLENAGLKLQQKPEFTPYRKVVHLDYLPYEEKARLIQKNPAYGNIICRCENVSEGEIIDTIRNGATTIEGIKKRARVCAGDCQGGFCMPRIVDIMIKELGIEASDIIQDKDGSYIIVQGESNDN